MKKNIKHFFLLTALAAGTIHFVNRFINMTADIKNILKNHSFLLHILNLLFAVNIL